MKELCLVLVVTPAYAVSDNNIIIDSDVRFINNLNPFEPSIMNVYHPLINKRKASSTLELTRSPQEVINDFIMNQLGNFDFNDKFADPRDIGNETYDDLEDFAKQFFDYFDVSLDINRYIRAQAAIFTKDLINSLKRLVPARAAFSKVGVEVKPTLFERPKLPPPKLEKQILSFEATIPFTDWEKDMYSLTTIDNLQPIFTPTVYIEKASATGSSQGHYDYTSGWENYTYHSNTILDMSKIANDKNLPSSSLVDGDGGTYLSMQSYNYPYHSTDFFNVDNDVDQPDSLLHYTDKYEMFNTHDIHIFDVLAHVKNKRDNDKNAYFTFDNEYPYYTHTMNVASATGSIAWDFSKLEPLHTSKNLNLFDIHHNSASIADNKGMTYLGVGTSLYKTRDLEIFNIHQNSSSIADNAGVTYLDMVPTLHPPKNMKLFSVDEDVDGDDSYFHFTDKYELYETRDASYYLFDRDVDAVDGYFHFTDKFQLYKTRDMSYYLFDRDVNKTDSYLHFTDKYELYKTKDMSLLDIEKDIDKTDGISSFY